MKGKRPWFIKKKITIPLILLGLVGIVRIVAVPLILNQLNKTLAVVNPVLSFHVGELKLSFLRGAGVLKSITGSFKTSGGEFLRIEWAVGSISWSELLKGKLVTEFFVDGAHLTYSEELKAAVDAVSKKEEETLDLQDITREFRLEKFEIKNSTVNLADYPGIQDEKKLRIEDIRFTATNVLGSEGNHLGHFSAEARPGGLVPVTLTGQFDLSSKPPRLSVDGNKQEFKGPKHFLVEVATGIGNLILRAEDRKSVSTKIAFSLDKAGVHVDTGEALSKSIQHGYEQKLSPNIENRYELKQAQEE